MTIGTNNLNTEPKLQRSGKQKILLILKNVLLYGLIFVVLYSLINWWRQPIMPASPQLQLTDYQGQVVDLATLSANKPMLVYFWGTWCPVCKVTSPKVNKLARTTDYPVVTIAIKSNDNGELKSFMAERNFTFTTINDADGKIFADWQGQVTPSYVILKDGEMAQGLTGVQPLWSLKLRLWLSSIF